MRTAFAVLAIIVAAGGTLTGTGAAQAQMPLKVGACVKTTIVRIGTRFSDRLVKPRSADEDDGATVMLRNGVYGVSYQYVEAIGQSRIGDPVITCLVSLPKNCPKGDDRGKSYTTTNLRTQEAWSLPDSQHMCGGA